MSPKLNPTNLSLRQILLLSCLLLALPIVAQSTSSPADSSTILNHPIDYLDFKNTDIKDVLRALAVKYNLNIFVEDNVQVPVTLHLSQVTVLEAIQFLVSENNLVLEQQGRIFKIRLPPPPEVPPPPPLTITFENNRLTLDVQNEPLEKVLYQLSQKSGRNIVLNQGVRGQVSGFLQSLPLKQGLQTLLSANGFELRERDGVFLVDYGPDYAPDGPNQRQNRGRRLWVEVKDSLISVDVTQADIKNLVEEMARQLNLDVIFYGDVKGQISARWTRLPFEEALAYIFKNTSLTFQRDGHLYLIGDKNIQGLSSSYLVQLKHIKAEGMIELLPQSITSKATLKIIKEHNGLMVIGTQDVIRETERFIQQIDHPIPQILIEALVVDYTVSDISEFELKAGTHAVEDTSSTGFSFFPKVDVLGKAEYLDNQISIYGPRIGIPQVGKLPANFYLSLKAMESAGKANIRSRPQIATLNGHEASISIGTTQYYVMKTQTPYMNTNQTYVQQTEQFQTIKAEMLLKITPWVSANGEVTVEIHPEFSTPRGNLDPERPPTIDHRILDSTVRLRDGETIVLGGLIQEVDTITISKFPILGDIPLLGRLFQNRSRNKTNAELVIYVTPHLY